MDPQLLYNIETKTLYNEGYDEKADIWSLGNLCYEMLVGRKAFDATSMKELFQKVKQGAYTLPINLSEEVVSFINGMLQTNPNSRLSAKELKKHPFLMNNVEQIEPIDVRKNPSTMGPGDIMIFDSNIRVKNGNLNKNIWDIFNQPITPNQLPNSQRLVAVPENLHEKYNIMTQPDKYYNNNDMLQMVEQPPYQHQNYNIMTQPNNYYNNNDMPQMVEQPPYLDQKYNIKTQPNNYYNNNDMPQMVEQQPYHMKNGGVNTTHIIINNFININK